MCFILGIINRSSDYNLYFLIGINVLQLFYMNKNALIAIKSLIYPIR